MYIYPEASIDDNNLFERPDQSVKTGMKKIYHRLNPAPVAIIVVSLLAIVSASVQALSPIRFDHIGLEHGLSQSTVYSIARDLHGFMWFGTQDGLNRYDGYEIAVFKHNPNDSNSVSHNTIWALMGDRQGNLWIGTEGGVNCYRPAENRFHRYPFLTERTKNAHVGTVSAFCEDSNGEIWIGTSTGLNKFDPVRGGVVPFELVPGDSSRQSPFAVQSICQDSSRTLWVGTTIGLYAISLDDASVRRFTHDRFNQSSLSSNNIRSLAVDSAGRVWIGTWEGELNSIEARTGIVKRHLPGGRARGNNFYSIATDGNGDIWIATFDGILKYSPSLNRLAHLTSEASVTLYRSNNGFIWVGTFVSGVLVYNPAKQRFRNYTLDEISKGSKIGNVVFSILEDHSGAVWVGTFGNGLIRLDRSRTHLSTYRHSPSDPRTISSNRIVALCETEPGELWVGTDGGGLNRLETNTGVFHRYSDEPHSTLPIAHNRISTLFYDRPERILWVGYLNGTIQRIHLATNAVTSYYLAGKNLSIVSTSGVSAIVRGPHSGILVGTIKRGLLTLDSTGQFREFSLPDSIKIIAASNVICSILEHADGTLLLGTYDGLLRYADKRKPPFRRYTTADGLPSNAVYGILPDRSGNLWLSTNKGISRFTPATERFKNFDMADGLQSDEFNQGAYFASRHGELFFGSVNGFTCFSPEEIEDDPSVPPVYVTRFRIFNKLLPLANPIPDGEHIELTYAENFFTFEFIALNYGSPQKTRYAYQLEGFDQDWNYVSAAQRYAGYTNLDPGTYRLRVKASGNDGHWSDREATLLITITPPFWMTWWFRVGGMVVLLGVAGSLVRRKITRLEKEKARQQELSRKLIERQEEERRRIAQEMHDSLGQDLLFIKNLALLTLKNFPRDQQSDDHIAQISESASRALKSVRAISHDLRPPELDRLGLTETLRSILLRVRESTTLQVSGEIDDIDGLIEPGLEINLIRIVQEALANVVKHADASECGVRLCREENRITITVRDNGKGFDMNGILRISSARDSTKKPPGHQAYQSIGIGLGGMMERVRMLGGVINISTAPGAGTTITVSVPVVSRSPSSDEHP